MPGPIVVSVKHDFDRLVSELTDLQTKQLPFVRPQVANRLAKYAVQDLQTVMKRVFDRPTRWVLQGIYARTGTKRDPHGEVIVRDRGFGKGVGTPAADILSAEILGGQRKLKRFERALGHRVEDATYIVPGRGAELDAFGNIPKGQIQKILSALGAAETTAGYKANRTKRSGRRQRKRMEVYFVATSHRDGRPLAIYKVMEKGKVAPIFFFPRANPHYHERLDFYGVVAKSAERWTEQVFKAEMVKAIATATRGAQ